MKKILFISGILVLSYAFYRYATETAKSVPRVNPSLVPVAATGRTYYVDCDGDDSRSGLTEASAWKTIAKLNASQNIFEPGDNILFKRGCTWTLPSGGHLNITKSGTSDARIVYGAYGESAARPTIKNPTAQQIDSVARNHEGVIVNANFIKITSLNLTDVGKNAIWLRGSNNIVSYNEISRSGFGVLVGGWGNTMANNNLIERNYIHDLVMVNNTPRTFNDNDDFGAVAIHVWAGQNNEIRYNLSENCKAPSFDYGADGGSLEVYATGQVDTIYYHHNYSQNNNGFLEVGGEGSNRLSNLHVYYNISLNHNGVFAYFHNGQGNFGIESGNIKFYNNTFISQNQDIWIGADNSTSSPQYLTLKNNIFKAGSTNIGLTGIGRSHNLFDGNATLASPTEIKGAANFSNVTSDWSLGAGSRAIDAGAPTEPNINVTDFIQTQASKGAALDIGACESGSNLPCGIVFARLMVRESDVSVTDAPASTAIPTVTQRADPTQQQPPTSPTGTTPAPTLTQAPTARPVDTRAPAPTTIPADTAAPAPTHEPVVLNIRVRLQGVSTSSNVLPRGLKFKIAVGGGRLVETTSLVSNDFVHQGGGIYEGAVRFDGSLLAPGAGYKILVKGPKHIQKRICDRKPRADVGQSYYCPTDNSGAITLSAGPNDLDFTSIALPPGDLPVDGRQDSVLDALDFSYLISKAGSVEPAALAVADVNFDGVVDSQDYILLLNSTVDNIDEG